MVPSLICPRVSYRSDAIDVIDSRLTRPGILRTACLAFAVGFILTPASADDIDFNRDIRPILSNHCFQCHGPDDEGREAELRLDQRKMAIAKRDDVAAIVPGSTIDSLVIERVCESDPDITMPPPEFGKPLSQEQIDLLKQWIESGAEYAKHWSFEPIKRATPPTTAKPSTVRNEIDQFVHARLDETGIQPSPPADRYTLIRRVYLDLLGLPPSIEDVDQFVADQAAGAYERLLDRVLARPHFGERWGRHWLDQARYADSHGYTTDNARSIWPYRDWVIEAFNRDLPFDQFTIEQLAGDLLESPTLPQMVATGFHRNTLINSEGGTKADQFRDEQVKDRVDTTGLVWMGLTVGCAKCHTHKFDPLTQHEYYELYAFFNSTADANSVAPTRKVPNPEQAAALRELEQALKTFAQQIDADAERPQRQAAWVKRLATTEPASELSALALLSAEERTEKQKRQLDEAFLEQDEALQAVHQSLTAAKEELKSLQKSQPSTMVMKELSEPRQAHLQIRGDFLRLSDEVDCDVPSVLPALANGAPRRTRLDLANWLMSPEHPLTARVRVNRIWMRLFGLGLVETENDFGTQGTLPTHPELLDWLSDEFRQRGWSTKALIRLIVNSATYRQSSNLRPELAAIDARNLLLARQNRIRVEAEIVRDVALSVSGKLSMRIGGPSVYPPQEEGVYAFTQREMSWKTSTEDDRYRRGMYTFFYRSAPYPMLGTFDVPKFNATCTSRSRSNTPLQSLTVANSEAMFELAEAFAERIVSLSPQSQATSALDDERLTHAFRICFARSPDKGEQVVLKNYLQQCRQRFEKDQMVWVAVARLLMNLDEFITRG